MSFTINQLLIGGGGFSSGISVSADGLTVINRVDVDNCYIFNFTTNKWDSLTTTLTLPASSGGGGIEVVSGEGAGSAVIFMWLSDGYLYRSLNRGLNFDRLTGFGNHDPGSANGGNGSVSFTSRLNGQKMAVDPINAAVLYVGTNDTGVMVSTNATTVPASSVTFTTVASVPRDTSGFQSNGFEFAFDKNGGSSSGSTNILYCHSSRNGLYKMSLSIAGGGGSFTNIDAVNTYCEHMVCSPNSVLYLTDSVDVLKYIGGTLVATYGTATTGVRAHSIAVDTNNAGTASTERIIVGEDSGNLSVSPASGISGWSGILHFTRSSPLIPWLAEANEFYMSNGNMAFDATRNLIWFAEGIGVWTAPGGTNSGPFVWTSATQGIESLQFNGVISSGTASSAPSSYVWDRGFYQTTNPATYSAHQVTPVLTSITHGWSADWAALGGSNPATLVNINDISQADTQSAAGNKMCMDLSGTSSDNGQTWDPYPLTTTMTPTAVTASGASAAGQNVITCSTTFPNWFSKGMVVKNNTHPGTTKGWVSAVDPVAKTITMERPLSGGGVSNLDSLSVGFAGSPCVAFFVITGQTISGGGARTLHFTGLPSNLVQPAQTVYNLSNPSSFPSVSTINENLVESISGSDVVLVNALTGNVNVGDVIQFVTAGEGGSIAASSSTNFIATPANDSPFPMRTSDGGATWIPVDLGLPQPMNATFVGGNAVVTVVDTTSLLVGSAADTIGDTAGRFFIPGNTSILSKTPTTFTMSANANNSGTNVVRPTTGWGFAYTLNVKQVCADRVDPDTFYLYNSVTGLVYLTADKGVTWTPKNVGLNIATTYGANGGQGLSIQSVPGNSGHLFLSGANVSFQNNPLIRSTDHGATWNPVPNISSVQCFGFGAPLPGGGGYPTVWIIGQKSGIFSVWMSNDNCSSWIDISGGANPLHCTDLIVGIDGDKNIYGKAYGATNFSGAFLITQDQASTSVISVGMASSEW